MVTAMAGRRMLEKLATNHAKTMTMWRAIFKSARSPTFVYIRKRFYCQHREHRVNAINIQMLSDTLHRQIFRRGNDQNASNAHDQYIDGELLEKIKNHLQQHDLADKQTSKQEDVAFQLPELHGSNIDEHFRYIANQQIAHYKILIDRLIDATLPSKPLTWECRPGWTRYDGNQATSVEFPDEEALVFDVETSVMNGRIPVMATAVSPTHWYSWVSHHLILDDLRLGWKHDNTLKDLIPMEANQKGHNSQKKNHLKKLIVGHNIGYDRSYIREQYNIESGNTVFLDTMSLHNCVGGLTSIQRGNWKKMNNGDHDANGDTNKEAFWAKLSCPSSLADIYTLYTNNTLDKSPVDILIKGSMRDIKDNFQTLMEYCATDVYATHVVLKNVYKLFLLRCPHPVSFAGMLEMSSIFLPVDESWQYYLNTVEYTYQDLENELNTLLKHLADDACHLLRNDRFRDDPWLWSLNWNIKRNSLKSLSNISKKLLKTITGELTENIDDKILEERLKLQKERLHAKRGSQKSGYPDWYADLCPPLYIKSELNSKWRSSPVNISPTKRIVPLLLRLAYNNNPVYYDKKYGWGYLVLRQDAIADETLYGTSHKEKCGNGDTDEQKLQFPVRSWLKILKERKNNSHDGQACIKALDTSQVDYFNPIDVELEPRRNLSQGDKLLGPYTIDIPGVDFYKIPHKDGSHLRCGSPLSKDYLKQYEDGTITSFGSDIAKRTVELKLMLSYWKNAHDRVRNQFVVYYKHDEIADSIRNHSQFKPLQKYGAILPPVAPAGTVTRRAVEATWLTASNAKANRVGSELKAMIRAPPGYHFVGADVDSQELWIAALYADARFGRTHGCTAIGWMTLQGKKSQGTDLHSKTAETVGISRDQAKTFNYGRIYGAGLNYAQRLMRQFNPSMTLEDASDKAKILYASTKGITIYKLTRKGKKILQKLDPDTILDDDWIDTTGHEILRKHLRGKKLDSYIKSKSKQWIGGSESEMFNALEAIALSEKPKTPILECRISQALEPKVVGNAYLPSRINWVVQSSAVDYLHLILVCMRWLFEKYNINGRFCISIHDEVRYLVKSEDRFRAALALQITNLLTRAMFAHKIKIYDLPLSVAFFSAVDVDTVLRKEPDMDCKTPTNPLGLEKGYNVPPGIVH
ncbi:uncharacterized protein TRIADDRAFT_64268 [Trichoplax adhaerens]|uniref:DNA polymerase subunit gamma-1 n=1 Tax=Trichoplax adhaerens TaxID=10228 RepID=B3S7Y7_TRIAD|nr:hypothetical protein TRIADDRAFT_64268 [Trichoplax adhaerens]EDV21017.1 hypothetical protein TRIADDRAFT_64268 [Trichoplax adhaerens]|eukprot:XP_002116347.1 hypothetical protein TRIADDRAFT_64268 [Trichoplax adhaerens]